MIPGSSLQGDQPALLPDDLLDAAVKESQITEVETCPASAVKASNKEQLWDLFLAFMRKTNSTGPAPVLGLQMDHCQRSRGIAGF